jgi:4-hydroxy-tetrahydrodipicolinate synthase
MFSGTFTALITPFKGDRVDVEALQNLVELQVEQGADGLVACATTGESQTMSEEEDRLVMETVVQAVEGRVPVIAGTGSNSTRSAVDYTQMAEEVGADGSLQVAPYYNKPTQEGLYRHFAAVAQSTSLPVLLYNVPGRTCSSIAPETVARLAEDLPNVVGIKEASHSMDLVSDVRRLCGGDFAILSGDDALTLPIVALGGTGVVCVASNVAPGAVSEMVRALLAGDWERGRALHYELLPLFRALFLETSPVPVKKAASLLGLCGPDVRLPLAPMSEANANKLEAAMAATARLLPAVKRAGPEGAQHTTHH